jgi:hypothetical protein
MAARDADHRACGEGKGVPSSPGIGSSRDRAGVEQSEPLIGLSTGGSGYEASLGNESGGTG